MEPGRRLITGSGLVESRKSSEKTSAFKIGDSMSTDCSTDIDKLELPASLERIGRGIRVAGHRVSLFQIVDELLDGTPPERLREMFPTVPEGKLDEVISFCKRHDDVMRKYHEDYQSAFAAGAGSRMGEAPSLAELRRRKSEKAK
jgi:hypothetical protein